MVTRASANLREYEFSEEIKTRCLLWCTRHCCLCGRDCGVDIEVAHIDKHRKDQENAIPLCYDCHAKIGHYNHEHPRGNRYKAEELVPRREQIYEQYTRHLVPVIRATMIQDRKLPAVGFSIANYGRFPPVTARVKATVFLGDRRIGIVQDVHHYYNGETPWHLNPGIEIHGNFTIPTECVSSSETIRIQLDVKIIDAYEREHALLPFCYTHIRESAEWFLEPTSFENLRSSNP
jgi:hypothetical protein